MSNTKADSRAQSSGVVWDSRYTAPPSVQQPLPSVGHESPPAEQQYHSPVVPQRTLRAREDEGTARRRGVQRKDRSITGESSPPKAPLNPVSPQQVNDQSPDLAAQPEVSLTSEHPDASLPEFHKTKAPIGFQYDPNRR